MDYATVSDVEAGFRELSEAEAAACEALIQEAAIIIDHYNVYADDDAKRLVTCRMVRRQLGNGQEEASAFPMGSTQGSVSALGYSQSWTMGSGSAGELYLGKLEKKLLGVGNRIGSHSPLEGLCNDSWN